MCNSKRVSTKKLYHSYERLWGEFCKNKNCDPYEASIASGLEFLQTLKDSGKGYSVINTARSAISNILTLPFGMVFGTHKDVTTFMKGVWNDSPPVPRYTSTWDPDVVLTLLKGWTPASKLSIDKLSKKLVMLILLATGQRPQIISALSVDNMQLSSNSYKFIVSNLDLKQGRKGYKPEPICIKKFPCDKRLCPYHYLTVYLERTLETRGKHKKVILTIKKPHTPVTTNTVSRWVKSVLSEAGVDVTMYKPGSTRMASVSKAKRVGVPLEEILRAGGWSRQSTFTKFYDRPLGKESGVHDVGLADVLVQVDPK